MARVNPVRAVGPKIQTYLTISTSFVLPYVGTETWPFTFDISLFNMMLERVSSHNHNSLHIFSWKNLIWLLHIGYACKICLRSLKCHKCCLNLVYDKLEKFITFICQINTRHEKGSLWSFHFCSSSPSLRTGVRTWNWHWMHYVWN